MKKTFKKIGLILIISLTLFSCKKNEENETKKTYYYKSSDLNNDSFSYAIRKYEFNKDTIIQKYLLLDQKGDIFFKKMDKYIIKNDSLFILSNVSNDNAKYFFFSAKAKDSCNTVQMPLDSYKICYKGIQKDSSNVNLYKIDIETMNYHQEKQTLLLDKNYCIIFKNDISNNRQEIVIQNDKIDDIIKNKFNKASKKIKWW